MKIEHIAMYVRDIENVKYFFQTFFMAQANAGYQNPQTGLKTYFLTFDDHTRLEIMTRPEMDDMEKTVFRTGYIHIAFALENADAVEQLTEKLDAAGYTILSAPRVTGDGYYESCILGPENNVIELVAASKED